MRGAATVSAIVLLAANVAHSAEPTIVTCKSEKLPQMILTFRGGLGASDNTPQIGQSKPVPMSVGSSLMLAEVGPQSFTFSLRLPAKFLSALLDKTQRRIMATALARSRQTKMTAWPDREEIRIGPEIQISNRSDPSYACN